MVILRAVSRLVRYEAGVKMNAYAPQLTTTCTSRNAVRAVVLFLLRPLLRPEDLQYCHLVDSTTVHKGNACATFLRVVSQRVLTSCCRPHLVHTNFTELSIRREEHIGSDWLCTAAKPPHQSHPL